MPESPRRALLARAAVAALAALAAAGVGAQAPATETVAVTQRVRLEGTVTKADAERAALEAAMAEAVRRVAGVRVTGSETMMTSDSAGAVSSRYLASVRLDAQGHVLGWVVERARWVTSKGPRGARDLVYEATYRVTVGRDAGRADAGFRLTLRSNRDRFGVHGASASGNDEVVVALTATRDAHLVVASISGDSARRLVPNQVIASARLVAGESSEWPSAEWRDRGLHFRVGLPDGVGQRTEVLAAVATAEPVPWPRADGGAVSLTEFNRWLVGIPADRRAVAQQTVVVVREDDRRRQSATENDSPPWERRTEP